MKIVFVSRLYLPHLGGVEIHLKEISNILIKAGHEVSIVTAKNDKKLSDFVESDGIKIYRIQLDDFDGERNHVKQNKIKTKTAVWHEIQKLRNLFIEADIVHVHDVFWWLLPIYKDIKNKVYITFHGWETKFPVPINAKIHRFLVSKLVKGSIHVGDFIQNFYWDKPDFVTYGGINPMRFTKSNQQKNDVKNDGKMAQLNFTFIGRLEKDTDINLYLDFLQMLKDKKIDFKVTFVGDGSLKNQCQKYGTVIGFVKNISKYIVDSDIVFASSFLSILEAQCLGKVVLAFYSNELKKDYLELYPGSKFMFITNSVDNMLAKLELILKSRKLFHHMELEAKQFAQQQTWDKVVDIYLKLWNQK